MHAGRPSPTPPRKPDRESLALASGDARAFTRFHARFSPGLKAMFMRRTGRGELADDLAQQAWAQIWRALSNGQYRPERAAPSTFLYAVANHVWHSHLRTRRPARDGSEAREPTYETDSLLEHAELLDALRDCLGSRAAPAALSGQERAIVRALSEGATERELAARLGAAASTIHARKLAAYDKIRTCLARKGYTGEILAQMRLYAE
jgi:RNA polymerase sigma-70 factor (ECF subfamily)